RERGPARAGGSGEAGAGRRRGDPCLELPAGSVRAGARHRSDEPAVSALEAVPLMSDKAVRIGIGGPVGSGKTALVDALCKRTRGDYGVGVVTNDIFTRQDMQCLLRRVAPPAP